MEGLQDIADGQAGSIVMPSKPTRAAAPVPGHGKACHRGFRETAARGRPEATFGGAGTARAVAAAQGSLLSRSQAGGRGKGGGQRERRPSPRKDKPPKGRGSVGRASGQPGPKRKGGLYAYVPVPNDLNRIQDQAGLQTNEAPAYLFSQLGG